MWVIKTKEDERKKKKKGLLKGCFIFSFLLFCCFLIVLYFKKFFWSKFARFFVFWEFEQFRILEIFSYTFVWTLRWIWVCSDTGSNSVLNSLICWIRKNKKSNVVQRHECENRYLTANWQINLANNVFIQFWLLIGSW